MIDHIFKHSLASKDSKRATLKIFDNEQFDPESGLWWAEKSTQQRMVIVLSNVSSPLTTAKEDSTIWSVLDVPAYTLLLNEL